MAKATFIKNIGNVRLNGFCADLYQNTNGTASIRFDKNTHPLPAKTNMKFDSLRHAEDFIEENEGSNGASTLDNILNVSGINY